MMDWNHNGSYDAFDSATDYMLSEDMDGNASGSAKYAANQKENPVPPQEKMKPWQYLVTIYFVLSIVYAVILFIVPESALIALNRMFGNGIALVIIVLMILPGLVLFRMVMQDVEKEALSSDKNK